LAKTRQPDIEATTSKASDDLGQRRSGDLNVSHEYIAAVRTESYEQFRSERRRVIAHSNEESGETSDSSQPLSSRLLAELLSPDQDYVNAVLQQTILVTKPEFGKMVSGYFSNGEYVYRLCSHLLDSIKRARLSYSKIKNILDVAPTAGDFNEEQCHWIVQEFFLFMEFENPFSQPDSEALQSIRDYFQHLLQQLELYGNKVHRKLTLINTFKKGSSLCLIGLCISIVLCAVVIATRSLVAMVAAPVLVTFPVNFIRKCESMNLLRRHSAQLDAATRGAYILNKHLDTMIRLVARLHNEVDNNKVLIRFCLHRKDDRYPIQEAVKQLRKNDFSFATTLDEIEDHVDLCLININRTRKLLVQEIRMQQEV